MAGYSGTPLPQKLGIKPKARVLGVDAPKHFKDLLDPLPEGVKVDVKPKGEYDVIVSFHRDIQTFDKKFRALIPHLIDRGGLWIAWPKKTSKLYVEGLHENPLRDIALKTGLVDNKICAIDEDWSGMRFVRRVR